MPKPISFGELDFQLVASMQETRGLPDAETPFRILIMGDFSGSATRSQNASGKALTNPHPILVDRDTFGSVLEKLAVEIHLSILGEKEPPVSITFSGLDDFHPESLYQRLDVFQALKDTRQSLHDPATLAAFVDELQPSSPSAPATETESAKPVTEQTSGDLLDQIIGQSQPEEQQGTLGKPATEWDSFLGEIVRPHLVPRPHPQLEETLLAIDAALSELMRMILLHPLFQKVEAAWRGLYFLLQRLETDENLTVSLLDLSQEELYADLAGREDLSASAMYKILVEQTVQTVGGHPWALVAGNYTFEKKKEDIELLARMAKIARSAGAPFIAGASDTLFCANSFARTPDPDDWQPDQADPLLDEAWDELRKLAESSYLGLALPRFLLRLPYGAETDPVDLFDFEEMEAVPEHQHYLWGNSCFACGLLLGQSFSRQGWQLTPGSMLDIDNLPLHIFKDGSESRLTPCAEVVFTERAAEMILGHGVMPLLSFLNQDRVRLARFQSLKEPLARLAGPWGE